MNNQSVLIINSGSLPIPPVSGGAVQQVLYTVARGLAERGWKVGILTPSSNLSEESRYKGGSTIMWHNIHGEINSGGVWGIIKSMMKVHRSLKEIRRGEYANVIVFDPYIINIVKSWDNEAKIIWSVHNVRNRTKRFIKWWAKDLDSVISISEFLKQEINKSLPVSVRDKNTVIYNPLPEKWFSESSNASRRAKSILFCGRIVSHKGLDVLIDALQLLPNDLKSNIQLGIAGATHFKGSHESEYSLKVRAQLEESNLNYNYLGYVDHANLHLVYDEYDLLVIPSNWAEPATLVAGEGQSRGCIIVASDVGGLPEMVHAEWHKFLVPPGSVAELAAAVKEALTTEHNGKFDQVKEWLNREFNVNTIVYKWEKVIQSI